MATTLFWPNRQNWCGCCNEALFELLNWPGTVFPVAVSKPRMQGERRWGGGFGRGTGGAAGGSGGYRFLPNPAPATGFRRCGAETGGTPSWRGFCFFRTTLLVTEGRASYNPSSTAMEAVVSLERFSNSGGLSGAVQDGFFLMEKLLAAGVLIYINWKTAVGVTPALNRSIERLYIPWASA